MRDLKYQPEQYQSIRNLVGIFQCTFPGCTSAYHQAKMTINQLSACEFERILSMAESQRLQDIEYNIATKILEVSSNKFSHYLTIKYFTLVHINYSFKIIVIGRCAHAPAAY